MELQCQAPGEGCRTVHAQLPRMFVFELTRRCNHSCGYCYNVWRAPGLGYGEGDTGELSSSEIREIVLKLQAETDVATICLSGGEPTLREDLPEIVTFIRSRGINCMVVSNGSMLTEDRMEALTGVTRFQIPLLSCREEIHDGLVGKSGAWNAVVEGMMEVHLSGVPMSAAFVATPQNWRDVEATARVALMLGADQFVYKRVNVGRLNLRHAAQLLLTPAMIEENLRTLDALAAKGFPVSIDMIIEPCVLDLGQFPHLHFVWCPMAGEDAAFVIDPAGNVRICEHSPEILGNIMRQSFSEIYSHPYVEQFRTVFPPECQKCRSDHKDECRGGCKAAAAQAYGSLAKVDPFVAMNR